MSGLGFIGLPDFDYFHSVTKSDLSHLPTKDKFYEQTWEILKRIDDLEIEKDLISERVSSHTDELEKIKIQLRQSSN